MRIMGGEISRIERDVEDYFDATAKVYEPTESRSGSGGTIYTFPANPTRTSPCQIAPMSDRVEAQFADRLGGRRGFVASMRSLTPVTTAARIKVGSRTFEVLGNDLGRSYQMRQRVPLVELT